MMQNRRTTSVSPQQLQMIHQAIFGQYDLDQNGFLDEEEVKIFMKDALMAGGNTPEEAETATKKFYHAVDKNGDGKISKEEITEILKFILQHKISQATRAARKL